MAEYYHRRITKRLAAKKSTRPQTLGTVSHVAILEPARVSQAIKIIPPEVLTSDGARRGKVYDVWAFKNRHTLNVKQDEWDEASKLRDFVYENAEAVRLIKSCRHFEHAIYSIDELGRKRKGLMDGIDDIGCTIIDLKTSNQTEDEFWKSVQEYGYGHQAAWYCDLFERRYGVWPHLKFIVVRECDCYVAELPPDYIERCRIENQQRFAELYDRIEGRVPWTPPAECRTLYLPTFM